MNMKLPSTFSVIPCRGKIPLVKWQEFTTRHPTHGEKEAWEKVYPNGDKGIVTGKLSKIFVLDDDGSLDLKRYNIPRTPQVSTPRGGSHHYFTWVPELDNKVTTKVGILDKVDVRGEGGFVAFYGWKLPPALVPFARPPKWLIDLLPNKDGLPNSSVLPVSEPTKFTETLASIKEGNRNASFTSLAGSMRARGYKPEEIFNLLIAKAREVNFSDRELRLVCQSVGRYEPRRIETQASSIEDFLAQEEKTEWIVPLLIAKQSIGFVAGLPESRKSWCCIDLAVACATGTSWLGKFPTNQCRVLLVDQERAKSETQRRLKAIMMGRDVPSAIIKDALFVKCGTTTRIDLSHSFDAFRKEISDIKPELIIVDSLATFHTKEESNRMEIQQVMEAIKQLREEFKCSFIFIHHETKNAYQKRKEGGEVSYLDMSGNIAISAAAESIWNIVKHDEESSFVHHTKSTLGVKQAPFIIRVSDMNPEKTSVQVEAY